MIDDCSICYTKISKKWTQYVQIETSIFILKGETDYKFQIQTLDKNNANDVGKHSMLEVGTHINVQYIHRFTIRTP